MKMISQINILQRRDARNVSTQQSFLIENTGYELLSGLPMRRMITKYMYLIYFNICGKFHRSPITGEMCGKDCSNLIYPFAHSCAEIPLREMLADFARNSFPRAVFHFFMDAAICDDMEFAFTYKQKQ